MRGHGGAHPLSYHSAVLALIGCKTAGCHLSHSEKRAHILTQRHSFWQSGLVFSVDCLRILSVSDGTHAVSRGHKGTSALCAGRTWTVANLRVDSMAAPNDGEP